MAVATVCYDGTQLTTTNKRAFEDIILQVKCGSFLY